MKMKSKKGNRKYLHDLEDYETGRIYTSSKRYKMHADMEKSTATTSKSTAQDISLSDLGLEAVETEESEATDTSVLEPEQPRPSTFLGYRLRHRELKRQNYQDRPKNQRGRG